MQVFIWAVIISGVVILAVYFGISGVHEWRETREFNRALKSKELRETLTGAYGALREARWLLEGAGYKPPIQKLEGGMTVRSVSLDAKPGPHGGRITIIPNTEEIVAQLRAARGEPS